ncbi:hypothetical protein ACJQWK_06957 [Exserohilum turcicum]
MASMACMRRAQCQCRRSAREVSRPDWALDWHADETRRPRRRWRRRRERESRGLWTEERTRESERERRREKEKGMAGGHLLEQPSSPAAQQPITNPRPTPTLPP